VLVNHPTHTFSFRRRLTCIASLAAFSILGLGCAGYTQKTIPGLSVSAKSIDFQSVAVGQQATKTFTVTNTGTAPVQVTTVSVTNKQFSVKGLLPQTLAPQSSATYTLTFAPSNAGSVSGAVDIATGASQGPATISLTGKGAAALANLVINPSAISFGNLALKSTSTQNVTLENTGSSALTLQGVTVSGAGFGYSDLSPGYSIPPNQKLTFQVWFSPKVVGPAAATLTLLSPSLSSPGTLSMSGDESQRDGKSDTNANSNADGAPSCLDLESQQQPGDWLSGVSQRNFGWFVQRAERHGHRCAELLGFERVVREHLLLCGYRGGFRGGRKRVLQSSLGGNSIN